MVDAGSESVYEMFSVENICFDGNACSADVKNLKTEVSEKFSIFAVAEISKSAILGMIASHFMTFDSLTRENMMYIASMFNKENPGLESIFSFSNGILAYKNSKKIGFDESRAMMILLNPKVAEAMEKCRQQSQAHQ